MHLERTPNIKEVKRRDSGHYLERMFQSNIIYKQKKNKQVAFFASFELFYYVIKNMEINFY